jgi:hypothetical protein
MLQHELCASTTDYQHERHDTHAGFGFAKGNMQIDCFLDCFLASRSLTNTVHDAKRAGDGAPSDHATLKLNLVFPENKHK